MIRILLCDDQAITHLVVTQHATGEPLQALVHGRVGQKLA